MAAMRGQHDPQVRRSVCASRSDIALPLPFPPTELQVMMQVRMGKVCESKNLNLLGGGCKWARWAVREAAGVWDIQVVVLQCRSWFHLQWVWWLQPPSFQGGRPRNFWSCRPNLVGPSGRRDWCRARMACTFDNMCSVGTSGQRQILPLSDRTSRPPWHPRVLERL